MFCTCDQYKDRNICEDVFNFCGGSPIPGELASPNNEPNSPVSGLTQAKNGEDGRGKSCGAQKTSKESIGPKGSKTPCEKRYLGVRVRMPVRDMLRRIRIARGLDPNDIQGHQGKASRMSGEKKRVTSSGDRRKRPNKQHASLEDLAIIVEVLEEDLRASQACPGGGPSAAYCPQWQEDPAYLDAPCESHSPGGGPPSPHNSSLVYALSPGGCVGYPSPPYSQPAPPCSTHQGAYHSDEAEETSFSPPPPLLGPPCSTERPSPEPPLFPGPAPAPEGRSQERGCSRGNVAAQRAGLPERDWSATAFFWHQLQREECLLLEVSDEELLAPDSSGSALLHCAVSLGKRATAYAIAKRMAALDKLDIKDAEGKTALHLAAQKNQHLMVSDLLFLGADVNKRDQFGRTCLHLSAENGYVRVLEVLRSYMNDGMYIDVEATDMNGFSALQWATVALNATVQELQGSAGPSETRFHTLRREQLLDTLECLLLMGQAPPAQFKSPPVWDTVSDVIGSYPGGDGTGRPLNRMLL
ncbi:NF-kappa-B inhibitor zeta [Megalops cyprinoides]|uniref:NF-kappa-B inhibitor zeta n=1 Tax=Megalops cyprinoides TaxID=118141 RepID=UPI001863E63C|nr:NF-kappa-B inhibitor zeta [Megalops cyprinoides]